MGGWELYFQNRRVGTCDGLKLHLVHSLFLTSSGFKLAICNSQFAKHFDSLQMNFSIFSKNCEPLKSDTS